MEKRINWDKLSELGIKEVGLSNLVENFISMRQVNEKNKSDHFIELDIRIYGYEDTDSFYEEESGIELGYFRIYVIEPFQYFEDDDPYEVLDDICLGDKDLQEFLISKESNWVKDEYNEVCYSATGYIPLINMNPKYRVCGITSEIMNNIDSIICQMANVHVEQIFLKAFPIRSRRDDIKNEKDLEEKKKNLQNMYSSAGFFLIEGTDFMKYVPHR